MSDEAEAIWAGTSDLKAAISNVAAAGDPGAQPVEAATTYFDVLAPYFGVFFVAWAVTIVSTPLMRMIAVRFGLVDWPDLKRKNHVEPVAYLGGAAIFLGWLSGVLVCWFVSPHNSARSAFTQVQFPPSIIAGATLIMIAGLIDDIWSISPRVKIAWQLFAAGLLAYNDMGIKLMQDVLGATGIPDPALIGPITMSYVLGAMVIAIFVIGACNAVNLLDGLDGLVAGSLSISFFAFLVIACYAALALTDPGAEASLSDHLNDPIRIIMCMAVLGALLGFLPHNFNPANIFMGDAGSLLLGYLSATTILLFAHSMKQGPLLVTAALIVFALPITDTALAIFRRVMSNQSIFAGDNEHLHHHLVRGFAGMGCGPLLSIKLTVVSMYILSLIFAVLGFVLVFVRWRLGIAVFAVIFGFVAVVAYKAGHRRAYLIKSSSARPDRPEAATGPTPRGSLVGGSQPQPPQTAVSKAHSTPS